MIITLLVAVLYVLVSVLVALAGLVLAQRLLLRRLTLHESHTETTGTIHQTISLVYGVAVGFAIIIVWQQLNTAQATTEHEASTVENIHRLAAEIPEPYRNQIQEQARLYAEDVVQEEWPLLAQGQASTHAQNSMDKLRGSIQEFEPKTLSEQNIDNRLLTNMEALENDRGLRVLESQEGMPDLLWIFLVIGAILTIASTYVFGKENPRLHMVRIAMLAAMVALSLYTVHSLEHPFSRAVQVRPDALENVLDRIDSNAEK
jgi:hypothetical protein